ncbi:MAG: diguanylate cyclase, partial [Candidatus Eremiobacteraeota bacterium]|nr:diguanylate cyclase [Candidatus Eremiobacteraeota bacterium]
MFDPIPAIPLAVCAAALSCIWLVRRRNAQKMGIEGVFFKNTRLVESEAALAASQRIAHLGSFDHNIGSNVRTWSEELYRIYGVPVDKAFSKDGLSRFDHPEDAQAVRETVENARIARTPYRIDHRIVRADGAIRYVQEQGDWLCDPEGNVTCNLGTVLDISDRKIAEEALVHLAYHDTLTGLPNRARLAQHLSALLSSCDGTTALHAVLFIDLDRFKLINDTLGHRFGDDILQAVAARFRHTLRDKDIVARPGGDEFIIVFTDVRDKLEVEKLAGRILEVFKSSFAVAGHEHFVSASIGISLFPEDGVDVDSLLRRADAAMYAAKAVGGNSYHFYTTNMQRSAARRFRIESALHRALEKNQFRMHYQPLLSVGTGNIAATEALLR